MRSARLLVLVAAALVVIAAAPVALAAGDGAVHRESVLTELDPTGAPGASRIFTQVTVPDGDEVTLPGQSTEGFRALLGDVEADGDSVRFGPGLSRTVADNTAPLPVEVAITYTVDGADVDPEDVVGRDGEVAVTYTVRNLTAEPTELTLVDGDGETSTETVDAAVPLVGSLSMTLPPIFRDVSAPGAVVVGDGRGNTVVNWSLLLFAPLGSETAQVTWTAQATDAVVPEASLQVIPVTPDSFGSFSSTEAAYRGAVESTTELTEGAREIDANLRLLAEGAAELLDGLVQLRDGARELAAGLVDARHGARELSAGLGQAHTGAHDLEDGLGALSGGASEIAAGLTALDEGNSALLTGLMQLSAGAGELAAGAEELASGTALLDDNAAALAAGASEVAAGAAAVRDGIEQLNSQLLGADGLPLVLAGIDLLEAGAADLVAGTADVRDGLDLIATFAAEIADPTARAQFEGTVAAVRAGVTTPTCDLTDPSAPPACGLLEGIAILQAGLLELESGVVTARDDVAAGLGDPSTPGDTLRYGAAALADGSSELSTGASRLRSEGTAPLEAGAAELLDGAQQLAGGASAAEGGADELDAGTDQLVAGSSELAAGAETAVDGATELADGVGQLDDGGRLLADGLVDAEDGGQQLADGLAEAAAGGTELADGAQQLVDEGTSVLADSVSEATVSSSLQLEQVRAVAARGIAGDGLPYPTADGAVASAVYQFDIDGVGVPAGPGVLGRVGAGILILAIAAVLGAAAGTRREGAAG